MLKGWSYSDKRPKIKIDCKGDFGCVYAVKLKLWGSTSLLKIGATREPNIRLKNYSSAVAKIFCVSKPCLNFFEIEELLHNHFSKYRVPNRAGRGSQPELFNMSLPFFFENLPDITYIVNK